MTPDSFKLRFPEFASEDDARVQAFIAEAMPHFDLERWGDFFESGIGYLVAHELSSAAKAAAGQNSGFIASKKVGDVTIAYDNSTASMTAANPYLATPYGQRYSNLRRLVSKGGVAV